MIDSTNLQLRAKCLVALRIRCWNIMQNGFESEVLFWNKIKPNHPILGNDVWQIMLSVSSSLDSNTVKIHWIPSKLGIIALNLVPCAMTLRQTYEIEMVKHKTSDTKRQIGIQKSWIINNVINRQVNAIYSDFSYQSHVVGKWAFV